MKSLGIGVVGTGDVALKLYFPVMAELDPSKAWIAAVCDVDVERAKRAQTHVRGPSRLSATTATCSPATMSTSSST